MVVKIVGTRKMQFRTKDGKDISGTKLHYTYVQEGTEGTAAESVFISDAKMQAFGYPEVGEEVDLVYNRYGKIEAIRNCY